MAVRWCLRYGLSYRDVEELLAEHGVAVDHVTVYRWVRRFAALFADAARPLRHAAGGRWFVDEMCGCPSADGVAPADLAGTPRTAGAGLDWTYRPVRPGAVAAGRLSGPVEDLVVAWDADARRAHLQAFVEEGSEDPATGSAMLGLGGFLAASGLVPDRTTAFGVRQGAAR